jgi:hypothetical protein
MSQVSLDPHPIFVVGYMHSGTTLLHAVLSRHPAVFASKGETRFFELLPSLRGRYRDLGDDRVFRDYVAYTVDSILLGPGLAKRLDDPAARLDEATLGAIVERVADRRDHVVTFRRVFDALMARDGKSRWLERTPTHVYHVDEILAACPGARIIEITRDARDILASKKTRRETVWTSRRYAEGTRQAKHLEKAYDPLWDALSWRSAIAAGRAAHNRHPAELLRVSYESLVSDPEAAIDTLCAWTGLDVDPAMSQVTLKTTADWNGRDKRAGIYKESVGRWHDALTPAEIALCQTVAHRELAELGYSLEPVDWQHRMAALALLPHSQRELLDRLGRRWRMGGFDYVRRVLRGYRKRLGIIART